MFFYHRTCLRIVLFISGLLVLDSPSSTSQEFSTSINPPDWGISNSSDIRLAQFSLVRTAQGPRFNVQAVYEAGYFSQTAQRQDNDGCLILADFDDPFVNLVGGSYYGFQSGSSKAELVHELGQTGAQTLRLKFTKGSGEYCGFWMHTFNSASPVNERQYLNATRFLSLTITLRGTSGRERLLLKAADDIWNAKEDALPVGELGGYLPKGKIDTLWQTAIIPIDAFPRRLNAERLATVVFEVIGPDSGVVEFSSIAFCARTPTRQHSESILNSAAKPERAVWVWNTRDLMRDQRELGSLRAFVRDQLTDHVFLAIPYDPEHPLARRGVPIDHKQMARVVRSLNASGLKVHALIGDKDFIKPEHREFVRTTIQNIIQYQQSAEPAAQFYGIHLDIEPYLLPGFGSARQSWFLQNLLEVFAECASLARSARLVIGADIPAWLDAPNELTHQRAEIAWNGVTKPAYQHIVDITDFVVLMDYRTGATGEGGFVSQAVNELRYAAEVQKSVFVGLETIPLLDETLFVIRGEPNRGMPNGEGDYMLLLSRNDSLIFMLAKDQLSTARFLNGGNPDDLLWWPISRETPVPASRLTFAGKDGALRLARALQDSESLLRTFPSFAGFAFHDYEGYRALLAK